MVTLRFGNAPLGSLLITKVSDDEKQEPLSDVEFLLTDSSGNFIGTNNGRYVTNSAGEILVEGLTPGTTVVAREVRAKPGYLLDDSPQYALIRSGETVGLEFRNAPAGNLVIVKRSSAGTHEPLEGVEFKITYADGSYAVSYTHLPEEYRELSFVCLRPDGAIETPGTVSIMCRQAKKKVKDVYKRQAVITDGNRHARRPS